jgi:putative photosynthetic complex assembly protein 2
MELLAAGLYAVFVWWFSTGLILYLDGLPRTTHGWSLLAVTAIALAALVGLAASASDTTPLSAFIAFSCAIVCWGWQEMTLYLGILTGPRTEPADPGSRGWQRFSNAVQVILYHEIAIIVMGAVIVALTWNGANQVGLWTYIVLWLMRLSAKMNVFLGVPNHAAEFLPETIAYLHTYFKKRPTNVLFPVSVTVSTGVTFYLLHLSVAAPAGSFEETAFGLLGALAALAVIEHWFLVLPFSVNALWSWGLSTHTRSQALRGHTPQDDNPVGTERRDKVPLTQPST